MWFSKVELRSPGVMPGFVYHFAHKQESSEEEASVEEMLQWDPPVRYFRINQWERVQPMVDDAIPGLLVLGSIR